MSNHKIIYVLIGIIAVAIFNNYLLYQKTQLLEQAADYYKNQNNENLEKLSKITLAPKQTSISPLPNNQTITQTVSHTSNYTSSESIEAVAVKPVLENDGIFETTTYQGIVMKIIVEIRDGSGLVLVNTAIPTGVDFQTSAKTAVMVAQKITNIDLSKKDVIFSISSENNQELQAVDGGSAGGAMTVLLSSEILGKTLNDKVLMTGTIQDDGTIGKIGGAAEKADAAGKYGAKIFLVPQGQATVEIQSCDEKIEGVFTYRSCTAQEKPLSPIIEKQYGMKVIEVNNIENALSYFNSTT
ncbi:MAG: hypothetical protein HY223_09205 [Thaumarchaeota archaeon]|nr:hypothetical protein [Nitrososphaerota archaeon]